MGQLEAESGPPVAARESASIERPLFRLAAALCCGSWLGSIGAVPPGALRAASALTLTLLLGAALRRRAARPRSSSDRLRGLALYALLALAAAQRAERPETNVDTTQASAWLGARGRPDATIGTWYVERNLGDRSLGRIGDGARSWLVPAGICDDGDLVLLLAGAEPGRWPRGPEPGPRASSSASFLSTSASFLSSSASFLRGPGTVHVLAPATTEAELEAEEALARTAALVEATERPASGVLPDQVVRLARAEPSWLARVVEPLARLRAHLLARVSRSGTPLARSLVRGLLFGDLSELPAGLGDLFVRTGTFHVLAVSGMQVGLVALWIVWPLGSVFAALVRVASAQRVRIPLPVARAALLFLFVPLAGAEPPVVRAAVAYGIGSLATLVRFDLPLARLARGRTVHAGRRIDTLSLWSLALALECLVHPRAPLSLSVALSYAATLGLILASGPVLDLVRTLLPGRGKIDPVGPTGRPRPRIARVLLQRLLDAALSAIAASIAAVLATLPCAWSRFGEWSPIGLLATPLLLLPVAVLLGLGALAIALPAGCLDPVLDATARATLGLLEVCDRVPGSPACLPPRPGLLVAAAVVATVVFLVLRRRAAFARDGAPRSGALARLAALSWAALLVPWQSAARCLELWALDVGNGTAIVLRAPGLGTWLFDAGSRDRPDVAREAVAPLLRRLEVDEVGIVLSHGDRDHDGALPWLCDRFPPRVWAGALPARCAERLPHETLVLDLAAGRTRLPALDGRCTSGELVLVRGADIEGNEGSRALAIRWRGEDVVLCGDAEAEGLAAWLRSSLPDEPLRLLSMPHHGSETELLGRLLAKTRPREVWISASTPPPIARELDRRGLSWRWTARDGPLHLSLPETLARTSIDGVTDDLGGVGTERLR